jgi:hypothetical protein
MDKFKLNIAKTMIEDEINNLLMDDRYKDLWEEIRYYLFLLKKEN